MCSYQVENSHNKPNKKLATTIVKTIAVYGVNKLKQPLPPCYPSNDSGLYWHEVPPVKESWQERRVKSARILIISIVLVAIVLSIFK